MPPSAVQVEENVRADLSQLKLKASPRKEPLKYSGSLDQYKSEDVTPIIGTEFPEANLVEFLNAPNADELLRDLAIKSMSAADAMRILTESCIQSRSAAWSFSGSKTT